MNARSELKEVTPMEMAELVGGFERVFGEESADDETTMKLRLLANTYGFQKVQKVLTYLQINGLRPPRPGRKANPVMLLFRLVGKIE